MGSYPPSWKWSEKKFSRWDYVWVGDRGFRYGMAVFESFPIVRGAPLFLAQHYTRLEQSCKIAGFRVELPELVDFEKFFKREASDIFYFARIYVTAGGGGVTEDWTPGSVLIFIEPIVVENPPGFYKLISYPEPYAPPHPGLKTANYWPNILALQHARKNECNEAFLFNARSELVSASMANIFMVRGGKIETPALECGARNGVIREWVMERREVAECRIKEADLAAADEIFLTNSRFGIMPVSARDGRSLPSQEIATQLRVEYLREVGEIAVSG